MSSSDDPHFDVATLLLVPKHRFLGLVWGCVGVSFCFLLFRIYVRLRVFRRLFDDDIFVILAWLILLSTAIVWLVRDTLGLIYISYRVAFGGQPPPVDYLENFSSWLQALFANTFLNICGLWCVKFSFLAFFRRLGYHVERQKAIWWFVSVATVVGWAISIGIIYYPCAIATLEYEAEHCIQPSAGAAIRRSYRIQIGCDFTTDFLITAIPINLLWKVQINVRQKLALIALFSLTIITMILSIVRVEVALRGPREDDTWFYFCTTLELTIAILVVCLVSYRSLFTRDLKPSPSQKPFRKSPLYGNTTGQPLPFPESNAFGEAGRYSESSSTTQNKEEIIPLDVIHVRNEYTVDSQV